MTLHESVLRAKLESILRREQREDRRSKKRFIGVQADGWMGREALQIGDETFQVVFCPSVLAVREQMATRTADGPRVVLVTDCDERELGVDVQARVFRNRFQAIDPWGTILEMWQATQLGATVPQAKWLQEELSAATGSERIPLVAGTILDLETVKEVVFRRLGLGSGRPDVRTLVTWASEGRAKSWLSRSGELREQVRKWIESSAGPTADLILNCVDSGRAEFVLPLGLVIRCLVGSGSVVEVPKHDALVRLERFVQNRKVRPELLRPWADAAEDCMRTVLLQQEVRHYTPILDIAEELLKELEAQELAANSSFLRAGLMQREHQFAEECEAALRSGTRDLAAVEHAARAVAGHELAKVERRRAIPSAVEMAVRLLRWRGVQAASKREAPSSFRAAALAYASEGSFVDWAREMTTLGYPHESLQRALRSLWTAVRQSREEDNQRFAKLCVDWCKAPDLLDELIPLESVLERVVSPLAQNHKLLLLVLDGASLSVFHELAADLPRYGWLEMGPAGDEDVGSKRYGVAVLPTVTEVSRTSLLTGRVQTGGQATERSGFESFPSLQRKGVSPRLLHKEGLTGDRVGIDPDVAKVVTSESAVVAIVINAVDDWLGKGDQDAAAWEVERIRPLSALLELAKQGSRLLLITSDHGHVREHDTQLREFVGNTRHRPAGAAGEGELLVSGPRVSGGSVVVPWTERLRYTAPKQNGYHGGISPQEVLVPLALFVQPGMQEQVAGYAETAPGLPIWWESDGSSVERPRKTPTKAKAPARKEAGMLPFAPKKQALVEALLKAPVFLAQKELALRGWPGDDRLRAVLLAFAERGDAMTLQALANTLTLPPYRLQGMLANFRRALNVDGSEGLEFDTESGTVRVQWETLRLQFGLDEGKS